MDEPRRARRSRRGVGDCDVVVKKMLALGRATDTVKFTASCP
jgi:hypothetical protein